MTVPPSDVLVFLHFGGEFTFNFSHGAFEFTLLANTFYKTLASDFKIVHYQAECIILCVLPIKNVYA